MQKFQQAKQLAKFIAKNTTKKTAKNVILFTLACLLTINLSRFTKELENSPAKVQTQAYIQAIKPSANQTQQLLQQGEVLYQEGSFNEAITVLQQAVDIYQRENNNLGQAAALTNLSLVYQQIGAWEQANTAVNNSLKLLGWDELNQKDDLNQKDNSNQKLDVNNPKSELLELELLELESLQSESLEILGQTLDIQAGLLLKQGKPKISLKASQQAEQIWKKLDDNTGIMRSQINQAQALRVSGFYDRSQNILDKVSQQLKAQPDSLIKVTALRAFGNTQQQLGDLEESQKTLQQALKIAKGLELSQEIALTELSLGNTTRSLGDTKDAFDHYQNAAKVASNSLTKVQAQINQVSLLAGNQPIKEQIATEQITEAKALIPKIQSQLDSLPVNQTVIYARINFARNLNQIANNKDASKKDIAQILAISIQQANKIGDERAQSYALGSLGEIYEQQDQLEEARDLTQQALFLAQKNNALDVAYLWEWQLGRLLKAQGNIKAAISAYDSAVATLNSLRSDLAAVNREVQFNFRDRVEPIYRQSVQLLLQDNSGNGEAKPDLDKVRQRIEALQIAELDNYFREACLSNEFVVLDKVVDRDNPDTAILYPIILDKQLEIILKLPKEELIRKTYVVDSQKVEETITQALENIVQPDLTPKFQEDSQQLYEWLIKPVETELENSEVKTLVFVPDGSLRNIPMAALYDGKQYLAQKYAIAISPGLQLFTPKALTRQQLNVLVGGLSKVPEGEDFAPLFNVRQELKSIEESGVSTVVLYNEDFTSEILKDKINDQPFQVVHFATHGQFSSKANETFILALDKRIKVADLDTLLRSREQQRTEPIELLVLSACETATGDDRAALGLAGVALRAGARSTLASLWQIGDDSTAYFIDEFYRQLMTGKTTSQALRFSQEEMLKSPQYNRPMYWAPYVLVGNWL